MAMDTIRHQCAFVASHSESAASAAFAQAYARAASVVQSELGVPDGILAAAELALAYALLRHRHWVHAPVLEDVLVDLVARDFGLARDAAQWLTQAPIAALRFLDGAGDGTNAPEPAAAPTDRDFLRYVFVACATAPDEAALVRDLGLGQTLLRRVRAAMASLVAVPSTESRDESPCDVATEARYLPEVDAEIAHVAAELAREQEALPWALQVHSLRYDVSSLSAPWGRVIAEHGARWLFDLLLTIGSRGEANESQLDRRLKQLIPGGVTSRLGAALTSSSLLRALEPLDLVYPTAAGKRRTAEDTPASRASADAGQRWRLTEKAQELTAEAFACQRANAAPNAAAVVELLKEQNPAYQAALVRTASALDAAHLEAVVRSVRPLSPAGLKEAVLRLAGLAGEDATRRHVAALLETECSPWLRKAACETLASLGSARDVAPLLARIVKSDTSAAVRAAARQVADRSSLTLRLDAVAAPRSEPLALGPAEATVS